VIVPRISPNGDMGRATRRLSLSPWWSQNRRHFLLKTTDGDRVLRRTFAVLQLHREPGLTYAKGQTALGLVYDPHGLTQQDPGTISTGSTRTALVHQADSV
jgi:hypothetical protein